MSPDVLLVDYGGVLTTSLADAMGEWCRADGVDPSAFGAAMRRFLGEDAAREAVLNPVHALERGEMQVPDFEARLAGLLRTNDGRPLAAEGLLQRMFAGFRAEPAMVSVVRRARAQGVRTGLLSNSWGMDYPREGWAELFDVVVISGEVGMRKPDPDIYLHTAGLLGVEPARCVFVDDLPPNVRGAVAVGMVGVHHREVGTTVDELEVLLGVTLRGT